MAEPEKLMVLLSTRVARGRDQPAQLVDGSSVLVADCGHRAFIAPSGVFYLEGAGRGTRTVCTECYVPDPDTRPHLGMAPGAGTELSDALGVGAADQFLALLRDAGVRTFGR